MALAAASGLRETDVEDIEVLIDAREWELALDTLCTQIYEYDVPVDASQMARLDRLGTVLNVPVRRLLGRDGRAETARDDGNRRRYDSHDTWLG